MSPQSRQSAREVGSKWYFTGKPCPKGHISKRLVSSSSCQGCVKAYKFTARGYLTFKYKDMRTRINGKHSNPRCHIYKGLGLLEKSEFIAWALADSVYNRMFSAYEASGFDRGLAPTIDRIDTQRGYVTGNIQFLSTKENATKACLWRHHGINPITKAI